MIRYLYRLALPGGRRLLVVYYPPKPEPEVVPRKAAPAPGFDRTLAQFGPTVRLSEDAGLPKALKRK